MTPKIEEDHVRLPKAFAPVEFPDMVHQLRVGDSINSLNVSFPLAIFAFDCLRVDPGSGNDKVDAVVDLEMAELSA